MQDVELLRVFKQDSGWIGRWIGLGGWKSPPRCVRGGGWKPLLRCLEQDLTTKILTCLLFF